MNVLLDLTIHSLGWGRMPATGRERSSSSLASEEHFDIITSQDEIAWNPG
jgi:hypothetical protein